MSDSSSVYVEDVPDKVFETLVDQFGEKQDRKYHSFVATQSLRSLMGYLSHGQVIEANATADITDKTESLTTDEATGRAASCLKTVERLVSSAELNYDRGKHGEFPWHQIKEYLDSETSAVDDLAVRRLVIRVSSDDLEDHLRDVLTESIGLSDRKYLRSPFFFEMKSRVARGVKERDLVKKHNDEEFLKSKGYRVLENKKMYSLRAMQDKSDPVLGKTPRELEDMSFNHNDSETKSFGALYSMLVINKWRTAFSRSIGETTMYTWNEQGMWERADVA